MTKQMKRRAVAFGAGIAAFGMVPAIAGATTVPEDTEAEEAEAGATMAPMECETVDEVSLQLQWFIQAQFGGYLAAVDQGFYEAMCLDVEILEALAAFSIQSVISFLPPNVFSESSGIVCRHSSSSAKPQMAQANPLVQVVKPL